MASFDIDTSDMPVFGACFCCNSVLYLDFPAFVGCSGISDCLCIHEEFCLKQGAEPMPWVLGTAEGFWCQLGAPCCSFGLKDITVLLKSKAHCCCMISNAAFPLDKDTPAMCAVYGLMCFPVQGCCIPIKQAADAEPAVAAPATNQS